MLKRWFDFSMNGNDSDAPGSHANGNHGVAVMEREAEDYLQLEPPPPPPAAPPPKAPAFDQIYQNAAVKPPQIDYGILKVMSMADSPHLLGMPPEATRCALLMALEAAGAQIEDLLQDAVVRQRALNDYEEKQQAKLRDFETAKMEQNQAIQGELDRITREHMARIQANTDEVTRQQETVRAWQATKQHESQRMTEAAAFLVPQGGVNIRSLSAVLERASGSRR